MKQMLISMFITFLFYLASKFMVYSCNDFELILWKRTGQAPLRVVVVVFMMLLSGIHMLVRTFMFLNTL